MITMTVLAALVCAWVWLRARRRQPGRPQVARRGPAMLATVAVLVCQALLASPAQAQTGGSGCEAPNPERPGSGMVGAIDTPEGNGEAGSAYADYSYAGMVWHVHDCDSGVMGGMTDPSTTVDTWLGNQLFNVAKNIVGATNALHYEVLDGGVLQPLTEAVSRGAEAVYNNVYAQLFGLAALLLAIFLFRNIWRGDLATVSKRALFAIGGLWLAASSLALLQYHDEIDHAIVQTTTNIQAGFVDEEQDRVVRHILPTELHEEVVYDNWLRGTFGNDQQDEEAKEYGPDLLDAQAFTWDQMRAGDDGDENVINEKKAEFERIAGELQASSGYFSGEDGSRAGTGFLAMLQSLAYSLFQLVAKLAVLLAQILVRLFTLTAPLIGLLAILQHDVLRKVGRVIGGVAFNLLVLSVLAGIHALLLQAIFAASGMDMIVQLAIAGLVTIMMFVVGRPARRLWQMVETSVSLVGSAVPSQGGGLFSRFRKKSSEPTPQDEFWQTVKNDDEAEGGAATRGAGAAGAGGRFRPEATIASAQRLDGPQTGAHPASHWPGARQQVGGASPALPAGGGAAPPVFNTAPPSRGSGDQQPMVVPSRRVDTAPVTDRGIDRADDPDPFVVPSRMNQPAGAFDTGRTGGQGGAQAVPTPAPAAPAPAAPEPRRADSELVAGKPVYVLYRPSRGLEVRPDDVRDTDRAVR
ncbi:MULTISPECIES: magnesium transporter [Prauserella salsuginis group]|uniref:Magnesium transporter n=1 Tax=Prauserella salsuginis TaxID=387889 RepID=A0ABW6G6G0_9PSEU|nr:MULTISPECIES: magnesium transporter [Prauserella salsuginis group]MCR3722840.1 hypothetical protein [Prauserella flava]MCR3737105.1 hypothetical protein [Prauserella salsuginis]